MSSALRWLLPRCHDTKYLYHTPNYWGGKKGKMVFTVACDSFCSTTGKVAGDDRTMTTADPSSSQGVLPWT